jgi:hypothetical protein
MDGGRLEVGYKRKSKREEELSEVRLTRRQRLQLTRERERERRERQREGV